MSRNPKPKHDEQMYRVETARTTSGRVTEEVAARLVRIMEERGRNPEVTPAPRGCPR